ncbi:MAG: GNAT family protein [Actinomycetota bacterium]
MMRRRSQSPAPWLTGRRVTLRPLRDEDFDEWREVRLANEDWLLKWEPLRPPGTPDPVRDRSAFHARCDARRRDRQAGTGYGFGVFIGGSFAGEMNLSAVSRGAHQSCYVGYWIDHRHAGNSYTPEALVAVMQFAFEELKLHRVQISIIPRNSASRRVVEKLDIRDEGVAQRYLQINGVWEDHLRYAVTYEEWLERGTEWANDWL